MTHGREPYATDGDQSPEGIADVGDDSYKPEVISQDSQKIPTQLVVM